MKKQKLIVIGNGMAGARVIEEILKRAPEAFEIVIFGAENYGNYNRILLSNILNQTQLPEEIFINPLTWYKENNIRLHCGFRVVDVDTSLKKVKGVKVLSTDMPYSVIKFPSVSASDELIEEDYDYLIFATGSRPFVPPLEGSHHQGVFMFRTLDDCSQIISFAKNAKKAVVVGGGLLGLEAARGLLTHNMQVIVVEASPHLMPAQLDVESAQILKRTMQAMGVEVLTAVMTTKINDKDGIVSGITFKDGTSIDCDMVVISAGIRPITELALKAGLKVQKGIVCNDQMRTSDESIFAVGECVEHNGMVYGLVEPIWEQAKVLANVITQVNAHAAYKGSKLTTKLKVMGVELVSMGEKEATQPNDEVIVYRDPNQGVYKKLIVRDNKILGAILLGDTELSTELTQLFVRQRGLPKNRAEVLFGSMKGNVLVSAADLPDSAQICNCNGITKKEIVDAITNHQCLSVSSVGAKTKAGKGCGSCRGLIAQIIESKAGKVSYDSSEHYYVAGVPLEKSQLVKEIQSQNIKSVSEVFEILSAGKEDPDSKAGLASLLKILWPKEYVDQRDARFINDRVHANIQKDGTFSVVPRIYGGVTTPEDLMKIAQAAVKYQVKMVKFTGGQRIDLLGVKKEDLPKMWKDLGMPSGHAYTKAFRTCKSCVGTDFCRYGLGDSIKLAQEIEQRFQGIESPHKMKLATAGCPRNCSEAYVKDIGAVSIGEDKWEIYIGGAAGGTIRKGDLLAVTVGHEETIKIIGRFMQYYREHAKYLERTYSFAERIGIKVLRGVIVEDSLGIAALLDDRIQQAVDAYYDPWKEAEIPAYENQFEGPRLVEVLQQVNNNG